MSSFADRQVVITGGTGALGRAVTKLFVECGATCHVPVFDEQELQSFPLQEHERVLLQMGADLTDEAWVAEYYGGLTSLWASIHLAGGFAMTPFVETSAQQLHGILELNLVSCFLSSREAAKLMARGGGGRIVNVAARPALEPSGGMVAYSVAKAAVASLTQSVAEELRDQQVLVNAVAPSIIDTPRNRADMPDADHESWPKAREVAEAIAFLASPQNTLTSGTILPVYGHG